MRAILIALTTAIAVAAPCIIVCKVINHPKSTSGICSYPHQFKRKEIFQVQPAKAGLKKISKEKWGPAFGGPLSYFMDNPAQSITLPVTCPVVKPDKNTDKINS